MARIRALIVIAVALVFGVVPSEPGAHAMERCPSRGAEAHAVQGDDDECEADDADEDEPEPESAGPAGAFELGQEPIAGLGAPKIRYAPGELLVRFRGGTTDAEMRAAAGRAGGTIAGQIAELGVHIVDVSPGRTQQALVSLRSEPSVASVDRDVLLEALDTVPNDALWSTQWGSRLVGAPQAWDVTRGASTVVIAVLDTGLDALHPDLAGATVSGRDLVNDDFDPADDHGHGTAVAGVIAARTNNHEGQAGVCWVCSLMPVKVMDSTGTGATSTIAAGIVWAVDHGARVLNMSFGSPGTTNTLEAAIAYASAKGAVLVAAAGNSGADAPFYPAAYADVVGVAATTESDARYSWSEYGSWVDVAAPGCNTAPKLGGGYVEFCGTSSATPIVSGIAGLAMSLNPTASRTEVVQAIEGSATLIPGVARFGRVNAPKVMTAIAGSPTSKPTAPGTSPATPRLTAPVNVRRPRLRGLARVGRALRVVPGAWSPAPVRLAYEWRRCARNGGKCRTIVGASGRTYRLERRDRGHRLQAVVVAVGAGGVARAASGASAVVRVARPRA